MDQIVLKEFGDCQKVEADLQRRYVTLQLQIEDMRPNLPARTLANQFEAFYEEESSTTVREIHS